MLDFKNIPIGSLVDGALAAVNELDNGIHKNKQINSIEFNKKIVKFNYSDGTWAQAEFQGFVQEKNKEGI